MGSQRTPESIMKNAADDEPLDENEENTRWCHPSATDVRQLFSLFHIKYQIDALSDREAAMISLRPDDSSALAKRGNLNSGTTLFRGLPQAVSDYLRVAQRRRYSFLLRTRGRGEASKIARLYMSPARIPRKSSASANGAVRFGEPPSAIICGRAQIPPY